MARGDAAGGTPARRWAGVGAALALGLATAALLPAPAMAATGMTSGWWTTAPVPAPDVGDGLLVQGGPAEPTAVAAVSYELEPDEDVLGLTLTVADGSATTPGATLRACPLTQPFEPAAGRPADEAPHHDCTVRAEAAPSADGRTYAFDLSGFGGAEALGVALLPTTPTDRVVLEAPGTDAVESTVPSTPAGAGSTTTPPAPATPPAADGAPAPDLSRSSSAPPSSRVAIPPVARPSARPSAGTTAGAPSAPTGDDGAEPAPSPLGSPQPVSADVGGADDGGGSPLRFALLLVLAGGAATLWGIAGRGESAAEPVPA